MAESHRRCRHNATLIRLSRKVGLVNEDIAISGGPLERSNRPRISRNDNDLRSRPVTMLPVFS